MKHFKSLIKELHLNKPKLAHFTNKPGTKQSSVAVIFRINKPEAYFEKFREEIESYYCSDPNNADFSNIAPIELIERILEGFDDDSLEVLLTQRASSTRDINSGFIVFPGGKCEDNQTDLCACIRQTKQQVGLHLITKSTSPFTQYLNCYLGRSPTNFFYRKYKGTNLYASCHFFLLLHNKPTLILNAQQVQQSHWTKLTDMLSPAYLSLQRNRSQTVVSNAVPKALNFMKQSIIRNIEYTEYSVIDVGFKINKLWGFTLYLWLHICRIIEFRMNEDKLQKSQGLNILIKHADKYKIKFRWYYLPGILFEKAAMHWHYKNRSLPSQYPPKYNVRGMVYLSCLVVVVVACCWYFT